MAGKSVIFISATSDLRSARDLVGKVLYSMGFEPVWQEIAATDGGELLDVLRQRLEPAALVIQLVGQRYGAEPPQPTADFGRVSYTQFEALEAERVGKKVIYHFLDDSFPVDPTVAEPPALVSRQAAYRQRLKNTNRLRYEGIVDSKDLELSIHRIKDELAALRRQADRRHRELVRAAKDTSDRLDRQTAELSELRKVFAQVAAAVSLKPLAAGQTEPDPIPPEILAQAQILLECGDEEQRALGMIALKQHEDADRLIQQLKNKPGNPIDEASRLLTLEGDNWYQAGEPDKALGPYEQAYVLRPDDFQARTNLISALTVARLGNVVAHRQRAIDISLQTLKLVALGTTDWAIAQNNLGNALSDLPTGDKAENLKRAIAAYEAALAVRNKAVDPAAWAMTQNNLGSAWLDLPTGDKAENFKNAMAAFEASLAIRTKDAFPADWAMTQNNLGNAWWNLPVGDKAENLKKAMAAYEAALTVRTKSDDPVGWAMTQNNVGGAWWDLPTGNKAENLTKAIEAYEAALTVRTKDAYPADWALTQNNLGNAWSSFPIGDKAENLNKAMAAYEAALTVRTKSADPAGWAMTQNNIGGAWWRVIAGNKAENLTKAIEAYEAALTVRTKDAYPTDWAMSLNNLGNCWRILPTGDKTKNIKNAIEAYEAALTVRTKDAFPADWAMTQNDLGLAWYNLPTGDEGKNLKNAIAAFEAALTVYTKDAYPVEWATTQKNLEAARSHDPGSAGDGTKDSEQADARFSG